MSREKVKVEGYDASVAAYGLTIDVEVGDSPVLELYPDESKALRKALKRAERKIREARR